MANRVNERINQRTHLHLKCSLALVQKNDPEPEFVLRGRESLGERRTLLHLFLLSVFVFEERQEINRGMRTEERKDRREESGR